MVTKVNKGICFSYTKVTDFYIARYFKTLLFVSTITQ